MAKGKWVVYTLDETKAGRRWIAGPSFASKEAAEKQAHEYRGPGGVPTEVKFVSTTADPTTAGPWAGQIKPPKSERGLSRQRRRQEAERITKKVKITDDKIDLSKLTSAEKARIKQITGVKAEDAFEIKQTPTTKVEFEKSLLSKQRAAETTQKIEARKQQQAQEVSLSTGGVPLTILGDPRRMAVERTDLSGGFAPDRPISPGETMQLAPPQLKREKTLFDIGGEIQPLYRKQEFVFRDISKGEIAGLQAQAEMQRTEQLGKALELGGVAALGAEFSLGVGEAKGIIPEAAGFGVLSRISPQAAGIVGTTAILSSIPSFQGSFRQKGVLRTLARETPSLAVFAAAGGAGARGAKLKKGDIFTVETPKTQRFIDADLIKGKLTTTKVTGKDITTSQIDLTALGSKGVAVTQRVVTAPATQPTISVLGGSFFGGLDISPAIPLIFGRVKKGKGAKKLSKAELRKQSFDVRRSPIFVSKPQQEVGIRFRSQELKAKGVKERVIARGAGGITRITDIGLAPRRKGLTTIFGKTEKSLIETGTISTKQKKIFSQAETLRKARQSGAEIEKVISTGKGGIILQQSLKVKQIGKPPKPSPKPISEIKRNIVDARSLELFKELRPTKKTTEFKLPKETRAERNIRLSVLKQQQEGLRGGYRPGTREDIFGKIQRREAQRRLQQEISREPGVLPGGFGLPKRVFDKDMSGDIGKKISDIFGGKRKKKGILTIFEEPVFLRGMKPIGKGDVPAFSQLPSDIFTGAAGLPGRARKLRKDRIPPREDIRMGEPTRQIDIEKSLLGFDLGTQVKPILSTKLGLGLGIGLSQPADIGFKQFQDPQISQATSLDISQIPAIDTGIGERQAQDTAQEPIFDTPLDLSTPEIPPGRGGGGDVIDISVPDDPITDIIDDPITDIIGEPPPPEKPKRIKRTIFGFDEFTGVPAVKEGYDVIIREKGQDIELDKKKSFPRHRALNMGADIVDNSAAASFRIKKSKQPIASNIDDPFFILGHKFRSPARKSKLPPKQFIEKTGFRIDSPGELKGITAKGLIASRRKAAQKRFNNNLFGGLNLYHKRIYFLDDEMYGDLGTDRYW